MPITTCNTCCNDYQWRWEDAFDKFGFDDGDGQVMTDTVANVLRRAGYAVTTSKWTLHNTVIDSIKKDGRELLPENVCAGYGDPNQYLPADIIALLDRDLPFDGKMPTPETAVTELGEAIYRVRFSVTDYLEADIRAPSPDLALQRADALRQKNGTYEGDFAVVKSVVSAMEVSPFVNESKQP